MTERLYYHDSYIREFQARVTGSSLDQRAVYLDRSAFYPSSGGQPHDLGSLGGIPVLDVVDEGDRVAHVLSSPWAGSEDVSGSIDWSRRLDHMQQHTGQHLLSALFAEVLGIETVSFHLGPDSSTIELAKAQAVDAVQPRVCGEHECGLSLLFQVIGSAPRVRGTRERLPVLSLRRRFSPACAGNTLPCKPLPQ